MGRACLTKTVVSDSSPLIALARIGQLELLRALFGTVLVPEAVWQEVVVDGVGRPGAGEVVQASWIERRAVTEHALVVALRRCLGAARPKRASWLGKWAPSFRWTRDADAERPSASVSSRSAWPAS